MKLSDYAKQQGVRYETAWRWFRDGKIKGRRVGAHTILIEEERPAEPRIGGQVAVYTRVSSAENKSNLDSQAERLVAYCAVRGYQVSKVVKEIGSGVNDNRPKFLALLADPALSRIVIEHKDRGTRFGFRYIETLLQTYGREIEVVHRADNSTEDLLADLTSIIYSFCARLYGQRRAKRKTEKIVQELEAKDAPG
ncbi:MAG: IS607 family transposase [Ktedonobacteraceae bacterium]|nr:IS607 family transposase [Chloroflexota bacterium]